MSPLTVLWLVAGCLMLQPLSTDLYLASLPHLAHHFDVGPAAIQQTLTLFAAGFGIAQLLTGPLSDRYGRRPVLLTGLTIYALASLACAVAPTLAWLIAARFVQAIGCCTAAVVARALIRDAFAPAEGAKVLARASSMLALAPLIGPILGGYLQVGFGWRAAFVFHTAFCLVLGLFAWQRFAETHHDRNPDAVRPRQMFAIYRRLLGADIFWAWTLPGALSYASIFAFIAGSSFILIEVLRIPTEWYGYCFSIGVSGYLIGTLVCRRLLTHIGLARAMLIGNALSLFAGLLFATLVAFGIHHWTMVVGCLFLTMGAHGINFPCAQTGAVAPFPREAGAAAGLLGFVTMAAALATGTWVGMSHDGTLVPLSLTSSTIGLLLFGSGWALRHRRAVLH